MKIDIKQLSGLVVGIRHFVEANCLSEKSKRVKADLVENCKLASNISIANRYRKYRDDTNCDIHGELYLILKKYPVLILITEKNSIAINTFQEGDEIKDNIKMLRKLIMNYYNKTIKEEAHASSLFYPSKLLLMNN